VLANDDAPDIRDTVRNIDLSRLGKGKATSGSSKHPPSTYYVRPHIPPNRSSAAQSEESDTSRGSTVKQGEGSRGRTPERRPSTEVAKKMGGMSLGVTRAPLVESPLVEGEGGQDPFSQSFAEATDED
jgi:hypothetical protein